MTQEPVNFARVFNVDEICLGLMNSCTRDKKRAESKY